MQPEVRPSAPVSKPEERPSRFAGSKFGRDYYDRVPGIVATVTSITGFLNLVLALMPRERDHLHQIHDYLPASISAGAASVLAVSGLLLWRLGTMLRRRKRRAWVGALTIYAVLVVAHIGNGTFIAAGVSFVLFLLLATTGSRFRAKADPVSRWVALKIAVQFELVAVVWGMLLLTLASNRRFAFPPSVWQKVQEVLWGLIGVDGPVRYSARSERFQDVLHATLGAFSLITVVIVVLLILRPAEPIGGLSAQDESKLRELLAKQGARDSLGYFALRREKRVVWSPTGKAAITGRVVNGVFLVSGDPIGDPEAWPGAIAEYMKQIREYGWVPAVIGCSEQGATVFRREADLSAIELGDEAIVRPCEFSLDGRPMRGVRQACTRVQRAGYEVQVRRASSVSREEFHQLDRAAASWRGDEVERGFSMALSRLGDPADDQCVVATATQGGQLKGLLNFVPWGPDGLSLDLMRRDRGADNGLNEFMIVQVIEQASDKLGVDRISLNFAVFRDAIERGERIGAGPILRAWRWILVFASRWWQIESLYRFNVKFRPEWEPRFLSYPSTRDLPRIAVAALEAEAFITRPHRLKRLVGRA
ncbi:phosphatidylglycerol lysyltransferase domain-containing protein [Jatrophihabitans telluris]|uniref:Phosphatidylglycerol lysyltransferase domain-containing protein n=1 Tax=Jatrophihabitans telluris TaxID=2038343 RepID=A0ABY4QYP5_9ACTN|nr:phosphatidylglycerol lysyltransferase domain-containing protein [Jatrophihabitans telluris]UQX88758.1 phosphatidylglycerol lysyltransferase domain-containing protein [Jatrophihabitans telluris]